MLHRASCFDYMYFSENREEVRRQRVQNDRQQTRTSRDRSHQRPEASTHRAGSRH